MIDNRPEMQSSKDAQFVLHPHRSLSPRGFLIMMGLISAVSFIVGMVFFLMGAWPVFGFFGLDVALIYWAFKLNYRAGRIYETLHLTPELLKLTRVHPSGQREEFEFNPYWARVSCRVDRPDGRTSLWLAAQGKAVRFGKFLTDDERRDFADALTGALVASRGSKF
ncbi:DUF2244 domain-containing protein [Hyphomicrobium sp.]|jgi:uncharacterized membrane protein|uniref:DUF2244 domain-containing protein n=1 Tax=Hyphomicrobium sp. TaxID=82 RepID=UPI003566ECD8